MAETSPAPCALPKDHLTASLLTVSVPMPPEISCDAVLQMFWPNMGHSPPSVLQSGWATEGTAAGVPPPLLLPPEELEPQAALMPKATSGDAARRVSIADRLREEVRTA